MKTLLLLLLASTASAAPLTQMGDIGSNSGLTHEFSDSNGISTATLSAVSSYQMGPSSLWVASTTYTCRYNLQQNTSSGYLFVRIAGDSTANYVWVTEAYTQGAAAGVDSTASLNTGLVLGRTGATTIAGKWHIGEVTFETPYGSTTTISSRWNTQTNEGAGNEVREVGGGQFQGTKTGAPQFNVSAGTVSGYIRCKRDDPSPNVY